MVKSYLLVGAVLIFLVLSNSLYIVDETEQVIITQFGKPVGDAKTEAGLKFKIPLIQTVIRFDKRILQWDGSANEIPTKDNKYIFIDAFARWNISDPLEFYKSAKNEMQAQSRLDDIIDGAVRDEISNRLMEEIIRSTNREMVVKDDNSTQEFQDVSQSEVPKDGARLVIIASILNNVTEKLSELNMGIEVIDIQLKRINYNSQVREKLFNRMISDQNRIAEKYRAQGQGQKQEILGKQIQKKKELISAAYLSAQKIRGQADAKATEIYALSYGRSPDFYNFIKTLETYENTIDSSTQIILSTDSPYLKYLD
tara:strand:- start:762 stop:1697 length:936 start_codon:yes stop_codon:yes gene_type:complete